MHPSIIDSVFSINQDVPRGAKETRRTTHLRSFESRYIYRATTNTTQIDLAYIQHKTWYIVRSQIQERKALWKKRTEESRTTAVPILWYVFAVASLSQTPVWKQSAKDITVHHRVAPLQAGSIAVEHVLVAGVASRVRVLPEGMVGPSRGKSANRACVSAEDQQCSWAQ